MSRIEELISQVCPSGVRFQELGDVSEVRSGWGFPNAEQGSADGEFAFYKVGDMNLPGNEMFMTRANNYVAEDAIRRLGISPAPAGTVIFPKIGAAIATNKKRLLMEVSAYDNNVMGIVPGSELLSRFLLYVLQTINLSRIANDSGAVPSIRKSEMLAVRIPVPPFEVQREIVRILDTFTELEAELAAELEARRQQYGHYRSEMFAFSEGTPVTWSTLGGVSTRVSSGGTPKAGKHDYYIGGTIPWLRTNEVKFGEIWDTEVQITELALKETSAKWIPENCVIVAISGATAGRSAMNKIPLTTNQHCCNLEIDRQKAEFKYVFYWVAASYEQLKALGRGARSDLNSAIIKDFSIPLPSLDEQKRIVALLDRFDALVNDLSVGLPAELNARRKQYEYYRDKLLTFDEAPV